MRGKDVYFIFLSSQRWWMHCCHMVRILCCPPRERYRRERERERERKIQHAVWRGREFLAMDLTHAPSLSSLSLSLSLSARSLSLSLIHDRSLRFIISAVAHSLSPTALYSSLYSIDSSVTLSLLSFYSSLSIPLSLSLTHTHYLSPSLSHFLSLSCALVH
jgi:hypothetical protein